MISSQSTIPFPLLFTYESSLTPMLGIDYSLFLLSRFCEEVRRKHDIETAVTNMLWSTGHTVLVSGIV